ncbi:MAG: tetratricopeptide repeat protein [Polyangiaceae bacterium]
MPRFTPRAGTPSYVPATPLAPSSAPPEIVVLPRLGTLPGMGPDADTPDLSGDASAEARERMPTISAPANALPMIPSLQIPTINTVSTLPPPDLDAPPAPRRPEPAARSGAYSMRPHAPSLFEITAALDAGEPARALELTEQASAETGPELGLLAARALIALNERGRAVTQVERIARGSDLEPKVRATAARILLDAGRVESALDHARRALREDPDDPLIQVTCAWALTRALRRQGARSLAHEAETLLDDARLRDGPVVALVLGLRAALSAEARDFARALGHAQKALELDPRQPDAVAALAIAATGLGKHAEAEKAQQRLGELSPDEAMANSGALERLGLSAAAARPAASPWGPVEAALAAGQRAPAIDALKQVAADCLRNTARRAGSEAWQGLAQKAARSLTALPVFRHFAPFDCSVFSVERLEAGLSLLFGASGGAPVDDQVVQLLGAYVGESWRQAFGAEWQGVPAFPFSASVEGIGLSIRPCERVRERLLQGVSLSIETPHAMHPGADPLGNSVPLSLAPPTPWDPQPFPSSSEFSRLGRTLGSSVIGLYCDQMLGLPLDLSISGTVAIDRYVSLLAPPKAPPDPDAAWSQRVALLLGAYLGEVLLDAVGAQWDTASPPLTFDAYRLQLPHGSVANPVSRVLDRLAGRRMSPLSEYVARLASGRNSVSA